MLTSRHTLGTWRAGVLSEFGRTEITTLGPVCYGVGRGLGFRVGSIVCGLARNPNWCNGVGATHPFRQRRTF